ncbi:MULTISPECIES: ABC transporter permease [Fusobacterium]|uniref:ABC transporter permease n=1 Tax=Fusobacterium TaxID=848 RepID=UPI001F1EA9EB|nr:MULTISPECIES: ABC transporter permease [Fusobacterium]MCF2612706.1 ABC transporter permease [Fusobacterium perfoetens]MDY2980766.1 ABC transporter permease [Fusobacterium sp.]
MNSNLKKSLISNLVPILMLTLIVIAFPLSGLGFVSTMQEIVQRFSRNLFLVLSLLIPVVAGMGLNFGIVLGAMAGQIALIFITDWQIVGMQGIFLASIISIPFSILLGIMGGSILNKAKGREMITSMILGFFINGVYQLVVLYGMGKVIPLSDKKLLLSRGYGVRNAIDLVNIRQSLDSFLSFSIGGVEIPVFTFLIIMVLGFFTVWFRKTKLGQDMRAIGQDIEVAKTAGIDVDKTRIIAIVISTVLAGFGQIIYLQNMGTMNTYNSHEQIGMFSIAALLVGGANASKASIVNAISGVFLFHMLFIVSPNAGKELMGSAYIGEYFRVFVSYGVVALTLVLHQRIREKEQEEQRRATLERNSEKAEGDK